MTEQKKWIQGILTGLFPALLETILLFNFEPNLTLLILTQSTSFWFFTGLSIHFIQTNQKIIFRFITFTVFFNFPWYFNLSVIPEKYELLAPLIVMSIAFGALTGFINHLAIKHIK